MASVLILKGIILRSLNTFSFFNCPLYILGKSDGNKVINKSIPYTQEIVRSTPVQTIMAGNHNLVQHINSFSRFEMV